MWREFDWDPVKDRLNQVKHGVAFDEARTVFQDPLRRVERDDRHSMVEVRTATTGMSVYGRLLVVVTALDHRGLTRLISARRPTRRERYAYEND